MMTFSLTQYWMVTLESLRSWDEYIREDDPPFVDIEGTRLPMAFLRAVRMEGWGKVGCREILYENHNWHFAESDDYPWGMDALGHGLVPFRSIAIDRKVLEMGRLYLVRELWGLKLPDGTIHDGVVHACDTGGGIIGNHIDWFIGSHDNISPLGDLPMSCLLRGPIS